MDRQKKILLGVGVAAALGAGIFWASTASAAKPKTIRELLDRTHTDDLKVPAEMFIGKAALVGPGAVAGKPTGAMWARTRQAEGLEVYITASALDSIVNGSVTMIAVPAAVAIALDLANTSVFTKLPAI